MSPLQLSSMPLPTTSMAPGFTSSGCEPQGPGLSQQSPWATVQPSPSQSVVLLSQGLQVPAWQVSPAVQALPQVPQLLASFCVSTQALPHLVRLPPQTDAHVPPVHTSVEPQALPHMPQL